MFKVKNKGSRTNISVVITFSVVVTNKFHPFFLCSFVTSEHVFVCKNNWCIHGVIREISILHLHTDLFSSNTLLGIFSHFQWYHWWHVSQSAMFKAGFLMGYQTHGILHLQIIPILITLSGEKKVSKSVCYSGNDSKRPCSKHWRKCALILFSSILMLDTSIPLKM